MFLLRRSDGRKLNTERITKIYEQYKRRVLNKCGQKSKTQKSPAAITVESTVVLRQPNITLKECINLKRLVIVTFTIKALTIKS